MENNLIPFGKYKDQPVEILANDQLYADWLCQQDWFKSRYQNIYNIVINNFIEPSETAEHNKLVGNFFDDDFCISIAKKFFNVNYKKIKDGLIKDLKLILQEDDKSAWWSYGSGFFDRGYTYLRDSYFNSFSEIEEIKNNAKRLLINFERKGKFSFDIENRTFEAKGTDVFFWFRYSFWINEVRLYSKSENLVIECKPTVSEDYPAVLRQCRAQHVDLLLIETFNAESISFEQLQHFFGDIKISKLEEII